MSPPPKHIRLFEPDRQALIRLKGSTGLRTWNVPCRWALGRSLADPTLPPIVGNLPLSNVDIAWDVLTGEAGDAWWVLVHEHAFEAGTSAGDPELADLFRRHLHRGILRLANDPAIRSIADLLELAVDR